MRYKWLYVDHRERLERPPMNGANPIKLNPCGVTKRRVAERGVAERGVTERGVTESFPVMLSAARP